MVPRNYNPENDYLSTLLRINSIVYYTTLILVVFSIFRFVVGRFSGDPFFFFITFAVLSFFSMIIAHPGHGRYVFLILPTLIAGASLHVESLINGSNQSENKHTLSI